MDRDNEKLIVRDYLAIDRTKLANQRTLLSYIRTAIMLIASGVTMLKLIPQSDPLFYVGIVSLVLAAMFLAVGLYVYCSFAGKIKRLTRDAG